jgi:hypothetical protein
MHVCDDRKSWTLHQSFGRPLQGRKLKQSSAVAAVWLVSSVLRKPASSGCAAEQPSHDTVIVKQTGCDSNPQLCLDDNAKRGRRYISKHV